MSPNVTELLERAMILEDSERASLAGALIVSLEPPPEAGAGKAWDELIRRRVEELESGAVPGVPWAEAREQLFRGYE